MHEFQLRIMIIITYIITFQRTCTAMMRKVGICKREAENLGEAAALKDETEFQKVRVHYWGSPHGTLDPDPMRIGDPHPKTTLPPHGLDPDPSCVTVPLDSA